MHALSPSERGTMSWHWPGEFCLLYVHVCLFVCFPQASVHGRQALYQLSINPHPAVCYFLDKVSCSMEPRLASNILGIHEWAWTLNRPAPAFQGLGLWTHCTILWQYSKRPHLDTTPWSPRTTHRQTDVISRFLSPGSSGQPSRELPTIESLYIVLTLPFRMNPTGETWRPCCTHNVDASWVASSSRAIVFSCLPSVSGCRAISKS